MHRKRILSPVVMESTSGVSHGPTGEMEITGTAGRTRRRTGGGEDQGEDHGEDRGKENIVSAIIEEVVPDNNVLNSQGRLHMIM